MQTMTKWKLEPNNIFSNWNEFTLKIFDLKEIEFTIEDVQTVRQSTAIRDSKNNVNTWKLRSGCLSTNKNSFEFEMLFA